MYLKALEIQGFKSFPDKTTLVFDRDVTMIVGPNGSGKSNISDAVLWVMGEQRTRTLRGGKMEDVIFGGTEKRGKLGFAQVTLVLDNTAHIFPVDSDELSISRRYYRSGDSEYYINRESVRLRDVNELLMDTGLGRDGYSIIGQGRISEIVSAKSTDRRELFEQAAGISRYRFRKEEAERKLAATDETLLRVGDKIDELELQLTPLRKQAEVAKKYLLLREELRTLEVSAWMETLDKLAGQTKAIKESYAQAQTDLEKARAQVTENYRYTESISERMREKDLETETLRERLAAAESDIAENRSAGAVLETDQKNNQASIRRLEDDMSQDAGRVQALDEQIESLRRRVEELSEAGRTLAEKIGQLSNIVNGHRMKMSGRESRVSSLREELTRLTVDGRSMDGRIAMLTEMEKDYEGFNRAVKTVMREKERGSLRGIHGPVANLVRTEDRFALAIETALGAAAQNIIVDTPEDGRAAIEFLKRRDGGRATFLPISDIRGRTLDRLPVGEKGYLGLAVDLVEFDEAYRQIFSSLLGRTIIAETLSDAIAIARRHQNQLRIVSLDGQMINAGGSMTGGSAAKGTGVISRANELKRLAEERQVLAARQKEKAASLEQAEREFAAARYDMDVASQELSQAQREEATLQAEREAKEASAAQLENVKDAMAAGDSQRHALMEEYRRRDEQISADLDTNAEKGRRLAERAESIRSEIQAVTAQKLELEAKRTQADRDAQRQNEALLDQERLVASIERQTMAAEMEEKQLVDKLWDSYELSRTAAQAQRQPIESLTAANRRIAELRRKIRELGTPNLGAIEESERVGQRYDFLTEQRDDIAKAKNELLDIIRDITSQMEDIFRREFQAINESFQTTFLELFGGGKASLRLEDEDDVLNCGIEIKVQPPGKAVSNISLLSGGEKSFVAIALYFSILKLKPTPFCVMDEIEAALDEENVIRFASYLHRLNKTQFIVITHRRGTMEQADVLFGVTMQEKGVSRVIELDLAEAQKTAEA
ncbi:MAG: AAA family ATPase [Oscillospiraceae bacterium]|nr:AAA family ATPase [Oscillospiraceae bacterium]